MFVQLVFWPVHITCYSQLLHWMDIHAVTVFCSAHYVASSNGCVKTLSGMYAMRVAVWAHYV